MVVAVMGLLGQKAAGHVECGDGQSHSISKVLLRRMVRSLSLSFSLYRWSNTVFREQIVGWCAVILVREGTLLSASSLGYRRLRPRCAGGGGRKLEPPRA